MLKKFLYLFLTVIFICALVSIAVVNVVYYNSPFHDHTSNFYKSLRSLSPPLQAFMIIYLVRQGLGAGKKFNILLALIFSISFAQMLFVQETKIPVFIGLAVFLYSLRLVKFSVKRVIIRLAIFGIFLIGALYLNSFLKFGSVYFVAGDREEIVSKFQTDGISKKLSTTMVPITPLSNSNKPREEEDLDFEAVRILPLTDNEKLEEGLGTELEMFAKMIRRLLALKLVWRQAEVLSCFNGVVSKHWDGNFILSNQLFWLKALVPSVIWSKKPRVSRGKDHYSYCGWEKSMGPHSFSITLLGQPLIYGGWIGLYLHLGVLIVGLGGITWLGRNRLSLSTLSITALLPWLIAFDQDLTMYIANAAKFFIVMLPLIFIVRVFEIRSSS